MPPGVRLNLRDFGRISEFLSALEPGTRASVTDEALETVARLTEQRAKEIEIVRGRGLRSPPLPKRLSFRSGRLSGSISTDVSQAPRLYVVGSTVAYAPVHELGLGPYPRRAFLEPAAQHVIDTQADGIFRKALERARSRA
jgi:hypothetical protein